MIEQTRWRHLVIAGHEGNEPVARAGLTDSDPVARQLALGALERMGELTDDDVLTAFHDADPVVRHRAAMFAATRPHISLLPMLHDPDPTVVEAAAWAAGEQVTVTDDVLEQLCSLAVHADDVLSREAAVAALGAIGDERGLPAILHGCQDKPAIRRRAVLALAPFDGPKVTAALKAALEDRDWQVRQAAEDLMPTPAPAPRKRAAPKASATSDPKPSTKAAAAKSRGSKTAAAAAADHVGEHANGVNGSVDGSLFATFDVIAASGVDGPVDGSRDTPDLS